MKRALKRIAERLPYGLQRFLYTAWFWILNPGRLFERPLAPSEFMPAADDGTAAKLKLVGFLKTFNEAGSGNLERVLKHLSRFCDEIVVCDCGSTDGSMEIIRRYTHHVLQEPNDFTKELFAKQKMLDYALTLHPDWIVWLDADEVFDREGEAGGIRALAAYGNRNGVDGFSFHEYNLWKSDREYRVDELWDKVTKVNLWKNNGRLRFDLQEGLHRPQHPMGLDTIVPVSIKLIHYGFSSKAFIDAKYEQYKRSGQKGYMRLERLHYEKGIHLKPLGRDCFPASATESAGKPQ